MLVEPETRAWLKRHFGDIIRDVYFAGFYDTSVSHAEKLSMTKAGILAELQPQYFIDDQLKHVNGAAEIGIPSILFGDYSWNQTNTLLHNVTRCNDWHAVADYFEVAL
jgi:methionine salvage enolase-phosphatase E1